MWLAQAGVEMENMSGRFVFTAQASFIAAAVLLFLISLAFHWATKAAGNEKGIWALFLGDDGRASTSRFQVLLWTYALVWALMSLLLVGRTAFLGEACPKTADRVAGDAEVEAGDPRPECGEVSDDLTGALQRFLDEGIQEEYLLLLGFPVAAGVTASGIASSRSRTPRRPPSTETKKKLARLGELVTTDDQHGDVADYQYLLFNIFAVMYFTIQFVSHPELGPPQIPAVLVGLTGVSAAAYVSKKAVIRADEPKLLAVYPPTASPGDEITVRGGCLMARPVRRQGQKGGRRRPRQAPFLVLLDGKPVEPKPVPGQKFGDVFSVKVPPGVKGIVELIVVTADNMATEPITLTVTPKPPARRRPRTP